MFRFQEPTVNPPEQKMDIFRKKDVHTGCSFVDNT